MLFYLSNTKMNSKYSENNAISFTLNDVKYILPKHITDKMGIFNVDMVNGDLVKCR